MDPAKRYVLCAELINDFHFVWTVLLWGGAALTIFWHPYAPYQIIVLSVTLLSSIPYWRCILTVFEKRLRKKADPSYSDPTDSTFMNTYINKLFRTNFSKKQTNIVLGIGFVISYAISIAILTLPR